MTHTCEKRLKRLLTIVRLQEEKHEVLEHIRAMRDWVIEVEHIFDGSWARQAEEISNAEVGRRLDAWLSHLSTFVEADERTEDEQLRLGHLLSNATMWKDFRAPTMRWNGPYVPSKCTIAALVDARTGTAIYSAMAGVWRIKSGGSSNLMEMPVCKRA